MDDPLPERRLDRQHRWVASLRRHVRVACHPLDRARRRVVRSRRRLRVRHLLLVVRFRRRLVVVLAFVPDRVAQEFVQECALAADLAHVQECVRAADPVVLVVLVLVVAPAVLAAVRVLEVLVRVLAAVDLVVRVPAVELAALAAVPAAARVLVAALAGVRTVNVVRRARSRVRVNVASSTNCSRPTRRTPTAMFPFPKARLLSSAACRHRSSHRS